ncbi:MAG: type II toxin-antitoxin system RelE/ParE family toxin [Candidatus Margulisiibacteriota bacterium]
MIYKIEFTSMAEKNFKNLDKITQKRIAKVIDSLETNPLPNKAKKLINSEYWRVRVGDYRIIYFIENNKVLVLIIKIGHRRDIYKKLR